MGPIDLHVELLRARIDDVQVQEIDGTGWVIRISAVTLPTGWNKLSTHVYFVAPQGYPFAKPDCFWADVDLRLANGNMPQSTQVNNQLPGVPDAMLWFSWHVDPWNPNRDNLLTWLTIIKQRLNIPQ